MAESMAITTQVVSIRALVPPPSSSKRARPPPRTAAVLVPEEGMSRKQEATMCAPRGANITATKGLRMDTPEQQVQWQVWIMAHLLRDSWLWIYETATTPSTHTVQNIYIVWPRAVSTTHQPDATTARQPKTIAAKYPYSSRRGWPQSDQLAIAAMTSELQTADGRNAVEEKKIPGAARSRASEKSIVSIPCTSSSSSLGPQHRDKRTDRSNCDAAHANPCPNTSLILKKMVILSQPIMVNRRLIGMKGRTNAYVRIANSGLYSQVIMPFPYRKKWRGSK